MIVGIKYLAKPDEDRGTLDMTSDVSSSFRATGPVLPTKELSATGDRRHSHG